MELADSVRTAASFLDALVEQACRREVPLRSATEARHATISMMRRNGFDLETAAGRYRARSYFNAVVKRQVFRSHSAPALSARYVAAAAVADLRASGRDAKDVWAELERGWGGRIPGEVLEEYRLQLCG